MLSRPNWVPPGSTLGLQQMLARLGYLPVNFHYAGGHVPHSASAAVDDAI